MSHYRIRTPLAANASIDPKAIASRRKMDRAVCEVLEGRVLLSTSYQSSVLVNLGWGSPQFFPNGRLAIDAQGNLYGTMDAPEDVGAARVFELPRGSTSLVTLASVPTETSRIPADLLVDAAGNIYGTTTYAGSNNMGSVYEVVKGSGAPTTIASFNGANGSTPESGLTMDAQGNLYGTTGVGGANNDGTVFEIVKGSKTITTLASFDGVNGRYPSYSGVVFDRNGNLYGTTLQGGTNDRGTVFEIVKGSKTITSLHSFGMNSNGGAGPTFGVVVDAAGDIYGTTVGFGTSNQGMVFKISGASHQFTQIASFNGANGSNPSGLTLDANGNLFGTTWGAANGQGTVFEIAKGSNTIVTLAHPVGILPTGVIMDSNGNLYGAAAYIIYKLSPVPPQISGYTLVNADTDKDIEPLTDGMTLDLSKLPRQLNVRANTTGSANSVQISLDGKSRLELQAPWALFGDWSGDYVGGTFADGSHTITAQACSGTSGTGTVGAMSTLHFNVINRPPAATSGVSAIILYNTATGQTIRVLKDFDTLDLSQLPATLGIRVTTWGNAQSTQYVVDARVGVAATNALTIGNHTLTVIPFSGPNASGTPGVSLQLRLTVLRSLAGTQEKLLGTFGQ